MIVVDCGESRRKNKKLKSIIYSLIKEESNRPKYSKLLQHPFIQRGERSYTDVATYVSDILERMLQHGITPFTADQPAECWLED